MDSEDSFLAEARRRSRSWSRQSSFRQVDLNAPPFNLPDADLTLIFNVSSYVKQLDYLLAPLASRPGHVVVRQYDGAALRLGPMSSDVRVLIERSLRETVGRQCEFRHYDLDRLYAAIMQAPFAHRDISFELFSRSSPFPEEFIDYLSGMMSWMLDSLPNPVSEHLRSWWSARLQDPSLPTYFIEVDLCAVLS